MTGSLLVSVSSLSGSGETSPSDPRSTHRVGFGINWVCDAVTQC